MESIDVARVRDLLVHLYWQVDDRRVYQIIRENLGDLDAYRAQVARWAGADVIR
jgi:uncharacterized protein YutE (UPF0331/DUF86 family)